MEKSKVLIQFLVIFRQFGDVLFFLYARRLRGYTAPTTHNGTSLRISVRHNFLLIHSYFSLKTENLPELMLNWLRALPSFGHNRCSKLRLCAVRCETHTQKESVLYAHLPIQSYTWLTFWTNSGSQKYAKNYQWSPSALAEWDQLFPPCDSLLIRVLWEKRDQGEQKTNNWTVQETLEWVGHDCLKL